MNDRGIEKKRRIRLQVPEPNPFRSNSWKNQDWFEEVYLLPYMHNENRPPKICERKQDQTRPDQTLAHQYFEQSLQHAMGLTRRQTVKTMAEGHLHPYHPITWQHQQSDTNWRDLIDNLDITSPTHQNHASLTNLPTHHLPYLATHITAKQRNRTRRNPSTTTPHREKSSAKQKEKANQTKPPLQRLAIPVNPVQSSQWSQTINISIQFNSKHQTWRKKNTKLNTIHSPNAASRHRPTNQPTTEPKTLPNKIFSGGKTRKANKVALASINSSIHPSIRQT